MAEKKQGSAEWWNAQIEDRIRTARKSWLDEADRIVMKYESDSTQESTNDAFNILYSNTEVLLPALYNSTPRPDVERRYSTSTGERRLDSAVGQAAERMLEYSEDSGTTSYESFDAVARNAVLAALVHGQIGRAHV